MKLLLLSIFLLVSHNIEAKFLASDCPRIDNLKSLFISDKIDEPCVLVDHVQSGILSIQKFTSNDQQIDLFLNHASYKAFVNLSNLMLLSHRQKGWGENRSLEQSKIIWAHEFGHIIFDKLMTKSFLEIKPFYNYMSAYNKLLIEQQNPFYEDFSSIWNLWSSEAELVRGIYKPYSELFADLVAVLYKDDKEIMSKTYNMPGIDEPNRKLLKLYDFKSKENDTHEYNGDDIHFVFSKTKLVIGKMFEFPMSNIQKKNLLHKVHKAIIIEMKKLYLLMKKPSDYIFLNNSFIKTLQGS